MPPKFSFPEGHWNWPVNLTHQHAVRSGNIIFTGGQVDLDPQGIVRNPKNLTLQCSNSIDYLITLLQDLDADIQDLVKLVIYFVGGTGTKNDIMDIVAEKIGTSVRPVINLIAMPELCYPDMLIEIEGVAMRSEDGSRIPREHFQLDFMPLLPSAFSHVIRCGDMIFTSDISAVSPAGKVEAPNDIVEQTRIMMERLVRALDAAGSSIDNVLKLNAFFTRESVVQDWATPATIRADYFNDPGPAVTGIPVESFPDIDQVTQVAVTAYCGTTKDRAFSWPEGHWDWTSPLPYKHGNRCDQIIHVGGQVSLDSSANVIDPDNMVAQTRRAMDNIASVLAELGATLDDVVKVTTFYQGEASAEDLHENLLIRSGSYADNRGPATTGVPVPGLIYDGMIIEIEVIAVLSSCPF